MNEFQSSTFKAVLVLYYCTTYITYSNKSVTQKYIGYMAFVIEPLDNNLTNIQQVDMYPLDNRTLRLSCFHTGNLS